MIQRRVSLVLIVSVLLVSLSVLAGDQDTNKPAQMTKNSSEKRVVSVSQKSASGSERRSGEQIKWQVVSAGGTDAASASYTLLGTVAQTATGTGTSANYTCDQGFFYRGTAGPSYVCGDADGNGIVNISDAVYLISYIFGGGSAPDPYLSGDADCNQIVNISDAVYLIAYIFGGGSAPCAAC
jgi:hypothetical protein